MKRVLLMLGIVLYAISAKQGVAYADSGFLAGLKTMIYNVAQRTDVNGALGYVLTDAPSPTSVAPPAHANEWEAELSSTVALTPVTALYGSVAMGVDNRLLRSEFGVTRKIWGK